MQRRIVGLTILIALAALVSVTGVIAQQSRRGPAPARPRPAGDLKIKYRLTTGGNAMETVTMTKGRRQRSEMRNSYMDNVSITQCDLKRTIQINDKAQKYMITPMETGESDQSAAAPTTPSQAGPARSGGVVTYTTSATDTGERKEMFGFTARHVKTSMNVESSPDACNPMTMRMDTDGWYIDAVFEFDCDNARPVMMPRPGMPATCHDRTIFRRQGAAKTGFPLTETVTMYGPNGSVMSTTTREVVELSREPLDAALFDLPAGYTEAASTQEFYGMPSTDEAMGQMTGSANRTQMSDSDNTSNSGSKSPGVIRVGVVTFNNKSGKPVSLDSLRDRLLGEINGGGIEALPLNAISQSEAEAEAKAKQCDFILYTDISTLKSASGAKKLGGIFGKATGVDGLDKTDAKVDFKVFAVNESSPRLQSSATAKEQGDDNSAGVAIDLEAKQVISVIKRN